MKKEIIFANLISFTIFFTSCVSFGKTKEHSDSYLSKSILVAKELKKKGKDNIINPNFKKNISNKEKNIPLKERKKKGYYLLLEDKLLEIAGKALSARLISVADYKNILEKENILEDKVFWIKTLRLMWHQLTAEEQFFFEHHFLKTIRR